MSACSKYIKFYNIFNAFLFLGLFVVFDCLRFFFSSVEIYSIYLLVGILWILFPASRCGTNREIDKVTKKNRCRDTIDDTVIRRNVFDICEKKTERDMTSRVSNHANAASRNVFQIYVYDGTIEMRLMTIIQTVLLFFCIYVLWKLRFQAGKSPLQWLPKDNKSSHRINQSMLFVFRVNDKYVAVQFVQFIENKSNLKYSQTLCKKNG